MQASLLAAALDEIRRKLKAEGLYDRQRRLPMPLDITRVVVIHPANAASWADVSTQLMSWQQAGILTVQSLPAAFEGPRASQELVGALMQARTPDVSGQRPDLIVLVRGGGARSGLMALDNEAVARTICTSPIPVLTGLGHASDHSLLEDVAALRADTPSKALAQLATLIVMPARLARRNLETIDIAATAIWASASQSSAALRDAALVSGERRLHAAVQALDAMFSDVRAGSAAAAERCARLGDAALRLLADVVATAPRHLEHCSVASRRGIELIIDRARERLRSLPNADEPLTAVITQARARLDQGRIGLDHLIDRAGLGAIRLINTAEADLSYLRHTAEALAIEPTLARGFAVVRDRNSRRLVATRIDANAARDIVIEFLDGPVTAIVDPISVK